MKKVFIYFLFHLLICFVFGNEIPTPFEQPEGNTNATVGEFVRKQIDVIDEVTSDATTIKDLVTIHKPPTSLICNKTVPEAIKIVKNAEGLLYILSVNELLAIEVNERKEPHLEFLGTLLQFEEKPIEVQIENWQNMTFVILKLSSSLHVYVTKNDQRAVSLEPIQKISTHSITDRYILFKNKNDLYLVTYWIKDDTLDANELTFYKWKASFFSKESQELVDLPNKSEFFIFNEDVNEPLILSIGYGNTTRVVILKLNLQTNRWTKLQSLYFKQDYVRHYVIKGRLYLIGCSSDSFCAIYEWKQSLFRRYIKVNNQIFEKIKRIYYQHGMIITEDHQRNLSLYTTDDIVSVSPVLLLSNPPDVASYAIYKSPVSQKLFYVEFALQKTSMAINFYDITVNKALEITEKSESKHGNSVECVASLKSYLKNRIPTVQSSQNLTQLLAKHDNQLQMEKKKFLRAKLSNIKESTIRRVKMPNVVKVSATKLLRQSIDTNVQVEQTRRLLKRSRQPEASGRADSDELKPMEKIVATDLIYNGIEPIFEGLLLKSDKVFTFTDLIELRNLTANKLVVQSNRINRIALTDLLNATRDVNFSGFKMVQNLKVGELTILQALNNVPSGNLERPPADKPFELAEGFEFIGEINVKSLNVQGLNGFNVTTIMDNAFLQKERAVLRGNLILQSVTNVNQLTVNQLMDVRTNDLMTTSTNQTVKSNVKINKFYVDKLVTDTINNEKLKEIVATVDSLNVVEVPTRFMTVHVLKSLNILDDDNADEVKRQNRVTETIETLKQHVIGKQASDLAQIYNGRVVIRGSLVIKNLETHAARTKIILGGKEVPQNISNSFWMKSMKQEVRAEKFTINNQQVKAGSVRANFLNGHPAKKFMMLDANPFIGISQLTFENAIVEGHLRGEVPSLLLHLSRTVVLRQGPPVVIDGSLYFRGNLTVRNLVTNFINDQPIIAFVNNKQPRIVVTAAKNVQELRLNHLHVDMNLKVDNYNNVNIKQFTNDAVRIDRPIDFDSLKVTRFDAVNLRTEFFEDHQFNEFIESLDKQFQVNVDGSARAKRNVRISANVAFDADVFVETINSSMRFDDFLNMFVMKNEATLEVGGKKSFQQSVIVTNLDANLINQFPVERLLYRSLARGEKQTIAGEFFVKSFKTKSLRAKTLNSIAWNQFVDKTRLHLPLKMNLNVHELITSHLSSKSSTFDINKMMEIVQFPKRKKWNSIVLYKQANMPLLLSSHLDRITQVAVLKSSRQPQLITGQVQVNTDKLYVKSLIKPDEIINARLNLVNLRVLYTDSVKSQSRSPQVIKGIKTLLAPIYINDMRIESNAYFEAKEIDNVNIAEFNRTIVRSTDVIGKEKKFLNLHAKEIEIRGRLSGLTLDSLIFVVDNQVQLPKLNINQLELLYLKTYMFDGKSVLYFLQNRMRKLDGPEQEVTGILTFSSLNLLNDSILSSINQVGIDDIVYSKSDQLQDVTGHKVIVGNITLIGLSTVGVINDYDFSDFISNSVMRSYNFAKESMELSSIELKQGLVVKYSINGHRIEELLTSDAHIPKLSDLTSLMKEVQNQIQELSGAEKARNVKPKRVLYIDYVPDIKINYDGARDNEKRCAEKIIDSENHNSVIIREKRESSMIVELPSMTLTAEPNLHCHQSDITSNELSIWWKAKDGLNQTFFRNFSFVDEITDIKFMESMLGDVLMILTMLKDEELTSEIAVLWLNKHDNDWHERQPKLTGLNNITKSALVKTVEHQFLIVSSFTETSTSDSDYVRILRLDLETNMFIDNQQRLVGDKFDIILSVDVSLKGSKSKSETFLLLTRKGSKTLFVYRIKEGFKDFSFQRKIPFDSEIVEVVVLYVNSGPQYFIVSLQTGVFCVFDWRGIESWKVMQCGHFSFINQIKSYEYLKRQHLFLTSTLDSGTALTVHRQGEQLF